MSVITGESVQIIGDMTTVILPRAPGLLYLGAAVMKNVPGMNASHHIPAHAALDPLTAVRDLLINPRRTVTDSAKIAAADRRKRRTSRIGPPRKIQKGMRRIALPNLQK